MKKQLGLSLVELMISIALGLVLIAGVLQMFMSTKTSFTVQQGMSRIQETGRMAMEFIGRDLRIASQMGCVRTFTPNKTSSNVIDPSNLNLGGLQRDFLVGLMGYDNPDALEAAGIDPAQALIGAPIVLTEDSSVLVIRGATEKGFPVAAQNTANAITVFAGASVIANNCIDGLCVNGVAVVSDCDSGVIFRATALGQAGQILTVTHGGGWSVNTDAVYSYNERPEVFVYPMHSVAYFVAPSPTANDEPALWQKIDNQAAQELILGVERIRFTYRVGNNYLIASAVGALWPEVDAVRVDFVVRGQEENALESAQSYTFPGDAAATVPADRRIRQMFTNTFLVRTRNNQL